MKSKFGFIPIVLPVLVMVLIIGLINIGNAPWVQAHTDATSHTHNIPATHPRLGDDGLTLSHVNADRTAAVPSGVITLMPAFNPDVSSYKASATYDVDIINVAATPAGVTQGTEGSNSVAVKIMAGGKVLSSGSGDPGATSTIAVGQKTTIEVTVTNSQNDFSGETRYTIELTREMPQFNNLTLHNAHPSTAVNAAGVLTNGSPSAEDGDLMLPADILKGSNTLKGNDPNLRGNTATDVKVQYHVDKIGMELDVAAGLRNGHETTPGWGVAVTFNTRSLKVATTTGDGNGETYEIRSHPLVVGKNEIRIQVRSTSTRSHLTDYRIVIERAKPQMETAHYLPGSIVNPQDDNVVVVEGFGLDTTSTSTSVAYIETTTSVTAHGPGSGDVEFKYARKAGEGRNDFNDDATEAYDGMRLVPGNNTLYITAYDRENPANGSTRYTLTIVREKTPLGGVTLTSSSTNSAVDDMGAKLYWDATNQTSTRMGFWPDTTTYYASVDYDVEEIEVAATSTTAPPTVPASYKRTIALRGDSVSTTTNADTLEKTFPLRQGENVITVTAEIPGNSQTYTLNVTRKDPRVRPSELAVVEYKDNKGRFDFADRELKPAYSQTSTVPRYEVEVRSHIASVGIAADHLSPLSRIFVGGAKVDKIIPASSVDYNERLLTGDMTTIPVTVVLDSAGDTKTNSETINIVVIRNEGGDLSWVGDIHPLSAPIKLTDGRTLENPIILPESSSKDGALIYHVEVTDDQGEVVPLSDLGLELEQATRYITGTPTLGPEKGYESEFNVEYWASDAVGKETARREVVILITHDETPKIPARTAAAPVKNRLESLKVDDEAVTGFDPAKSGPYTAEVSADAVSAVIEAKPQFADAMVTLGNVPFGDDDTLTTDQFGVELTITVSHPDESADMTYTLTINQKDAVDPGDLRFTNEVGTKTYRVGEKIEALTLPDAAGGAGPDYTFKLTDHDLDATPADLEFNPKTRALTGAPTLYDDAFKTTYKLMYTVTDGDGKSVTEEFRMVICDPASSLSGDCRNSSSMVALSALSLSDVTLTPEFASDTMAYTADVPYETMMTTVTTEVDDVDAVMVDVMPGSQVDLATGANTITVKAEKEYGSMFSETYTVTVTRGDAPAEPTFTATRSDDGMSVMLEWPAVADATRHIVFLISGASLDASGAALANTALIADGGATTHTFSGLDPAQDYTVILVSGTPGWVLPWSEAMSPGSSGN